MNFRIAVLFFCYRFLTRFAFVVVVRIASQDRRFLLSRLLSILYASMLSSLLSSHLSLCSIALHIHTHTSPSCLCYYTVSSRPASLTLSVTSSHDHFQPRCLFSLACKTCSLSLSLSVVVAAAPVLCFPLLVLTTMSIVLSHRSLSTRIGSLLVAEVRRYAF